MFLNCLAPCENKLFTDDLTFYKLFCRDKNKNEFKNEPHHESLLFAYAKTKGKVTPQLISAFVFATYIVQSLFFLNTKFQANSHLLWLYSRVCV